MLRAGTDKAAKIDRRQALGLLGGAGLVLAVSACRSQSSGPATTNSEATALPDADVPAAPESRASDIAGTGESSPTGMPTLAAKVADVHLRLVAAPSTAEIKPGTLTDVWSFTAHVLAGDPATVTPSGSYLGPTLHFRKGQRVRVTFENRLPQESIVHWHGLVVPQNQDGQPPDAVKPGENYEYDFPVTNEPGTYWYHPHPHHLTGEQVYRGLAGLLIVHDETDNDDVNNAGGNNDDPLLPVGSRDLAFVLQDRTLDANGQLRYLASPHHAMAGFVGETLVSNGVAGLTVTVERRPYRLRLLNAANSRTQSLTWSTGDVLTVVATDGALLPDVTRSGSVVLTPAQRADLWMDFSAFQTGQRIDLLAADAFVEVPAMMGGGMGGMGGMGGSGMGGGTLVLKPKVAMSFRIGEGRATPGQVPRRLKAAPGVDAAAAINRAAPRRFELTTRHGAHWINGAQWEGRTATVGETVAFDTTEIWEFVNLSPIAHPMHLHGESFRVVERGWVSDAATASWDQIKGGVVERGLLDTVLVWPGQRVRIAVRFATHRGFFLYHCHIFEHEDGAMMRSFLVR